MQSVKELLTAVADGQTLGVEDIQSALSMLMVDGVSGEQMAAFLMALRVRGETVPELTGAAQFLRSRMSAVKLDCDAVDIVGTGGDSHGTYNVSTCAAIVAAGAGLKVAKHGNRSVSSKSGASDVLAELGVKLDIGADKVAHEVCDAGVGFMWAPMHHPAMKHWAPVRAQLGVRTLFNLLGPVCNPARVTRQVVGVFARKWVEPVAEVLLNLGSKHAWVVHGADGMDELSTTGITHVAEVVDGMITVFEVTPEDAGLSRTSLDQLKGGDAGVNAQAMRAILGGVKAPYRDIVVLNAGAALIVGGKAANLFEGVQRANNAIDSGAALQALEKLVSVSNS